MTLHGRDIRTVSVVIPAHNAARFVRDAIHSALNAQEVLVEIVVVDNASTDETRAVIGQSFGSAVRVVDEPVLGTAVARNAGIRECTGDYIAFLDADDVWLPGKLKRQVEELLARPEVGLVFTHGYEFHDPGLSDEQRRDYRCRETPMPLWLPSSLLAARSTIAQIGDFPNVVAGEFVAWYGWAQSLGFQAAMIPETYVRRRVHAGNTTRTTRYANGYLEATKWLMDRRRQAR